MSYTNIVQLREREKKMTTVSKNRNYIVFTRENGKTWSIDPIAIEYIGLRGNPVQNVPNGGIEEMRVYAIDDSNDVAAVLLKIWHARINIHGGHAGRYTEYCGIVEKFYNAIESCQYCGNHFCWDSYYSSRINNEIEHYDNCLDSGYTDKQILKAAKEINAIIIDHINNNTNIPDYIENNMRYSNLFGFNTIEAYLRAKEYESKFTKVRKQFGDELVNWAVKTVEWHYTPNVNKFDDVYLSRVFYYYTDKNAQMLVDNGCISKCILLENSLRTVSRCYEMGVIPRKESILTEYQTVQNNYNIWQNAAKERAFKESQRPEFAFENDDFVAIVPTTILELIKEGSDMNNCVGSYWLNNYGNSAKKFNRGVVFVRRKNNPKKSYITCDFTLSDMTIQQYLGNSNCHIDDESAKVFRKQLQAHLKSLVK